MSPAELRPSADPLPVADANSRTPVLMHRPLLIRQVSRDVLSSIAATWRPTNRIAVEPLLADVVRLRPTTTIPHVAAPSFGAGLQVLVDLSEAMQPFRRDQRDAVAALRRLAGSEITVLYFTDTPSGGVRGERGTDWHAWPLPPPGRPVVVLGTLGGGIRPDPAAADYWLRALQKLKRRAVRLAALVPVPRRRWSPMLAETGSLVLWDRATRARDVGSLADPPTADLRR